MTCYRTGCDNEAPWWRDDWAHPLCVECAPPGDYDLYESVEDMVLELGEDDGAAPMTSVLYALGRAVCGGIRDWMAFLEEQQELRRIVSADGDAVVERHRAIERNAVLAGKRLDAEEGER